MQIKKGYLLKKIDDTFIIVCTDTDVKLDKTITINETGEFIWQKLIDCASRREIIDAMCARYNASEELIAADTNTFLDRFIELGIVTGD